MAICKHLGKKYKIALPALEIEENAEGKEWIDAYKYWLSGEE